jgi:hypothetical protein
MPIRKAQRHKVGQRKPSHLPLDYMEREGVAIAAARQWQPKIKTRAQVKRKKMRLIYKKRGRVVMRRHVHENPLDFALSPESKALAEHNDMLAKLFGPLLQPIVMVQRRRGRLSNADKVIRLLNSEQI